MFINEVMAEITADICKQSSIAQHQENTLIIVHHSNNIDK